MPFSGSSDDTVQLWDHDIKSLIERSKQVAGCELTAEERKQYLLDEN